MARDRGEKWSPSNEVLGYLDFDQIGIARGTPAWRQEKGTWLLFGTVAWPAVDVGGEANLERRKQSGQARHQVAANQRAIFMGVTAAD